MRVTDERLERYLSMRKRGKVFGSFELELMHDLQDARAEIADRETHFRKLQNAIANVDCVVCQTCVGLNYVIADGMFCCCEECAEAVRDGAY